MTDVGIPGAAQRILETVLQDTPCRKCAYNLRGLVYMRLDDAGMAEDSFRRAIAINPRDPNTRHNYGWLLCQQNRYGDAATQARCAGFRP